MNTSALERHLDLETLRAHSYKEEWAKAYYSEQFCMNHEGTFEYPFVNLASNIRTPSQDTTGATMSHINPLEQACHPNIRTPSQDIAGATMRHNNPLEQACHPNSSVHLDRNGAKGLFWDPNEVMMTETMKGSTTNLQTAKIQQQNYAGRRARDIFISHKTSSYQLDGNMMGKGNTKAAVALNPRLVFSEELPMLCDCVDSKNTVEREAFTERGSSGMNLNAADLSLLDTEINDTEFERFCKMLIESEEFRSLIDSLPLDNLLPLQDSTASGYQEGTLSSFTGNATVMVDKPVTSALTATAYQFTLNEPLPNDLISYIGKESTPPHSPANVVPVETPKKRARGRPRNVQATPSAKRSKTDHSRTNPYTKDTFLSEKIYKMAISVRAKSAASKQEHSSPAVARGDLPCGGEYIPNSEDVAPSLYSPSVTSTDIITEDGNEERRKKNNEAANKSRQKRKELNVMTEEECAAMEKRVADLSAKAAKLEWAIDVVRGCIKHNLSEQLLSIRKN